MPAGDAPDLRRPMLFLFDGQNVFSDEGSFYGSCYAQEAIDKLPPLKSGWRRWWWPSTTRRGPHQRARPLEDGQARWWAARPWAGSRRCTRTMLGRTPSAARSACRSSFWFAGERVLNSVKKQKTPRLSRIYFDCGIREGEGAMLVHVTHMTEEMLRRKYTESRFMLRIDPRGKHNEKSWRGRLP